jgi:hypothetical protein
MVASMAE